MSQINSNPQGLTVSPNYATGFSWTGGTYVGSNIESPAVINTAKKKCDEMGCKNGKVLLLVSTVNCKKCNGTGEIFEASGL